MVLRAGGAVKEKGGIPEQKEKTHPAWAKQAETRCVLVMEGRKLCWNGWSRAGVKQHPVTICDMVYQCLIRLLPEQ